MGLLGGLALFLVLHDPFVADASAEVKFFMGAEPAVRARIEAIQILQRNMPGVAAIEEREPGVWIYRTERKMPLSDVVRTDFVLTRTTHDGVGFRTSDPQALNWMSFHFETSPAGGNRTSIRFIARVRLVREDASSIHIFAPLLGEAFISDRMRDDLEGMLATFADNVQHEFEEIETATPKLGEAQ